MNRHRHSRCLICESTGLAPLTRYARTSLVACRQCGMVFCPDIPTAAELEAHYETYSRDTSAVSPVSVARRYELLASFEPYRKTGRLLDVGCGVGELLNQARERGWETHGTEYTQRAVEICSANGHSMSRGPLDPAKYAPGSFDVVVYTEVLEHINNHLEEFGNLSGLLRPGGLLYVTTPNFDSLSRLVLGDRWSIIQYPEHLAYFTPRTLVRLGRRFGFVPLSVKTTGISIRRLRQGLAGARRRAREAPVARVHSVDEKIRRTLEVRPLRPLKRSLNGLLSLSGRGDTIKARFVRS